MTDHLLEQAEKKLSDCDHFLDNEKLSEAMTALYCAVRHQQSHLRASAPQAKGEADSAKLPRVAKLGHYCIECKSLVTVLEGGCCAGCGSYGKIRDTWIDAANLPGKPLPTRLVEPREADAEPSDECPHADCCQNEPCTGPGNPDPGAIEATYEAGHSHADGLADVWEIGKGHGFTAGIAEGERRKALELDEATVDRDRYARMVVDRETKLAAWEPTIRAALGWKKPGGVTETDALWNAIDAIPADLRPGASERKGSP